MLSTQALKSAAQANHYFLGQDNYYTENESLAKDRSQWWGKGTQSLGLTSHVETEVFNTLLEGKLPNGQQLGKKLSEDSFKHRPGFDLTFSAPKSVSLLALIGKDERIFKAVERATEQALVLIERDLAKARITKFGITDYQKTGNLVVARFLHDLSREGDPQLHTHCVVLNMTKRSDGHWRSLASQMVKYGEKAPSAPEGFFEAVRHHKKYYGAIFRAELAYEMKQLGYEIAPKSNGFFEIAGVLPEIIQTFSKRRQDIERFMEKRGLSGGEAAADATLKTRPGKVPLERESLAKRWKAQGYLVSPAGFDSIEQVVESALNKQDLNPKTPTPDSLEPETHTPDSSKPETHVPDGPELNASPSPSAPSPLFRPTIPLDSGPNQKAQDTLERVVKQLSEFRVALRETEILYHASQQIVGQDISMTALMEGFGAFKASGALIPLPHQACWKNESYFTTPALLKAEQAILTAMAKPHVSQKGMISDSALAGYLSEQSDLAQPQAQALRSLVSSPQSVLVLEGASGSGKTYLLKSLMELGRLGGYQPIGLTPSQSHRVDLEKQLKDRPRPNDGLAWLKSFFQTDRYQTVAGFLAQSVHISNLEAKLSPKPLILVENAPLLSALQMQGLMEQSERFGGRLLLMGDKQSLLTWQAGSPFAQLLEHGVTSAHLPPMKTSELAKEARRGEIALAFDKIGPRVLSVADPAERLEQMAAQYAALSHAEQKHTCVLMPNQASCREMNLAIREQLILKGNIQDSGQMIEVLLPRHLSAVARLSVQSYAMGQWLRLPSKYSSSTCYHQIVGVDVEKNQLLLSNPNPLFQKKLKAWDPKQNEANRAEVFEAANLRVGVGDRLVFKRGDKQQGTYSGLLAKVTALDPKQLALTLDSGKTIKLNLKGLVSKQSLHLDYGYTSTPYQTYHKKPDLILAYQKSTGYSSHTRSFYQILSQAKQAAWIYTEDKTTLLQTLQKQNGDKDTALGLLLQTELKDLSHSTLGQAPASSNAQEHVEILTTAVQKILNHLKSGLPSSRDVALEAVRYALLSLSEKEAAFEHKDVLKTALYSTLGNTRPKDIERAVLQAEKQGELVRGVYSKEGTLWTTQSALEREKAILNLAQQDRGQLPVLLSEAHVGTYLQHHALSPEQGETLQKLSHVTDRVVLIQGFAGTRKTTLLQHVQTLMHSQSHDLLCLAPTHTAVKEIRARGLNGDTLDHFLAQYHIGKIPPSEKPLLIAVDESSMISNRRLQDFLSVLPVLNARSLIIGDARQYAAIEAGKPFAILQKAGIQTLFLKDITRQEDPTLKAAVEATYQKEFSQAFQILKKHTIEIEDPDKRLIAIRDHYLQYSPEERSRVLVIAFGNEERILQNKLIREQLKKQEELTGEPLKSSVLMAKNLTEIDRTRAKSYQAGDWIRFNLTDSGLKIQKGDYMKVIEVRGDQNLLLLRPENNEKSKHPFLWKPPQLRSDKDTTGIEVYQDNEREMQAGDLIRWTKTDKELGMLSPELARVQSVQGQQIVVQPLTLSDKGLQPAGETIPLQADIKRHQHWDHAYAMTGYSAQGKSIQEVIIHAQSFNKRLATQPAFLVAISRAVKKLTIYTDDRGALQEQVLDNTGEKYSALETIGAFSERTPSPIISTPSKASPLKTEPIKAINSNGRQPIQNQFQEVETAPDPPVPKNLKTSPADFSTAHSTTFSAFSASSTVKSSSLNPAFKPPSKPRLDSLRIYECLRDNTEQVVERLLGEPKIRDGRQMRYGTNQGSLLITLQGDKRGLWHDFQTGQGGNLFSLIAEQSGLDPKRDFHQVLKVSTDLLGMSERDVTLQSYFKHEKKPPTPPKPDLQKQKSVQYARRLARESIQIKGTLAEQYLREHRLVPLEIFPSSLRFHPGVYSRRNESILPALLVVAKDDKQTVQAVQAIFLDSKTANKAQVSVKKQTWGSPGQCAAQLKGIQTIEASSRHMPITYLAEGPETALSIYAALGGADVRVTLGKSNFKNIDPKQVSQNVVLCLDNDGENVQSDKLVQTAAELLLKQGKQVWIAKPPIAGHDYNDILKLQGIESVQKELYHAIPYTNYINQTPGQTHLKSLLNQADLPLENLKTVDHSLIPSAIQAVVGSQLQEKQRENGSFSRAKEVRQEPALQNETAISLPSPQKDKEAEL